MAKVVAFFVEGPTEIEFYKAVVKYAHDAAQTPFNCSFKWVDMHGIGNYKRDALRRFTKIAQEYPNDDIYAFLCIDTDVFDLTKKKPPIDKCNVKKALEDAGAKKVVYIEAKYSIEDWFLSDYSGVLSYLRLPKDTKRPSGRGQDVLRALFKNAKKIYIKGAKTDGFIAKLNIQLIMSKQCKSLKQLCQIIGFDCSLVCNS